MTRWTPEETGRFWVVGGRYADANFRRLVAPAAPQGPFRNRAEAEIAWRAASFRASAEALVRFVVLEEAAARAA